jgi:REP element-mobilizing transposase RayT
MKAPKGRSATGGPKVPQSFSSILVHLVFSTKNREPWIRSPIDSQLFAYATTVLKNADCPALAMNGMADHVHTLLRLSRTITVAEVVKELKTSTSKWIKTKGAGFLGFHWQSGYGAFFSVSQSNVASVIEYIRNQTEHHQGISFQDEMRALLRKHEIAIDERYAWD